MQEPNSVRPWLLWLKAKQSEHEQVCNLYFISKSYLLTVFRRLSADLSRPVYAIVCLSSEHVAKLIAKFPTGSTQPWRLVPPSSTQLPIPSS